MQANDDALGATDRAAAYREGLVMTWPFGDLRMFGYNVILADPPWNFDIWGEGGNDRSPSQHYDTLSLDDIAGLPVGHLASDNCALLLWVVDPLLDRGVEILKGWGFRYVTVAFTWAKRTRRDTDWHMGTGYWTRANPETCLLGMTGSLQRVDAGVRQLIVDPVREHSRKPDRVRADIERLFGGPAHGVSARCELFGRTPRAGWDVWGNETEKFVEGAEPAARMYSRKRLQVAAPAIAAAPLLDRPLV